MRRGGTERCKRRRGPTKSNLSKISRYFGIIIKHAPESSRSPPSKNSRSSSFSTPRFSRVVRRLFPSVGIEADFKNRTSSSLMAPEVRRQRDSTEQIRRGHTNKSTTRALMCLTQGGCWSGLRNYVLGGSPQFS